MFAEYCNGKVCFSKKDAQQKRNFRAKGRKRGHGAQKLRIYQCPDCDYWHLTRKL